VTLMAWEKRGGKLYYYRSVRRGDKVQKVYLGTGIFGELAARRDEEKRERQAAKRDYVHKELERLEALAAPVLELDEVADVLAWAHLVASGCHRHKGEWRRERTRTI
jgi:hypothetical protein